MIRRFEYLLFHVVKIKFLSYNLRGVVRTANIEWSSVEWSLTKGSKTTENY